MKIAAIVGNHYDYLTETVLEGLELLGHEIVCDNPILKTRDLVARTCLKGKDFLEYTREAKLLITFWSHPADPPNYNLSIAANCWNKNVFVDGGDYHWEINDYFRKRCLAYFKREILKTSTDTDLIPLVFAIEKRYSEGWHPEWLKVVEGKQKTYDYQICPRKYIKLACLYDKQGLNPLRNEILNFIEKKVLEKKIGSIRDSETNLLNEWTKGRHSQSYFKTLKNSQYSISIKGGGYDCARFWESLANKCLVLTTPIEIKIPNFPINHVFEFKNLDELRMLIISGMMNPLYGQAYKVDDEILQYHSTQARAQYFLEKIYEKNPTITD